MSLSKTQILLALFMFYTILTVITGFIGATVQEDLGQETDSKGGGISVFNNIITGYSSFPWWLNTILFSPFIFIIIWIFASSLPTFNGGG